MSAKNAGKLGFDDCLCVVGELGSIGYWAIVYSLTREGAGKHTWDVPQSLVTTSFIKRQFAMQTIIAPTMWATKAAVLALYIRIFNSVRWMRHTSRILIVILFLFYGTNIVIASVYCLPHNGAPWDYKALARCSSPKVYHVVIGVFAVVADLVLFALPFPIIWNLHLPPYKKIGLSLVFLVGLLTIVTSVVSLVFRVKLLNSSDPMWIGINLTLTTIGEIFGTIIISCAPALYSFWRTTLRNARIYMSLGSVLSSLRLTSRRKHVELNAHASDSCSRLELHHYGSSQARVST